RARAFLTKAEALLRKLPPEINDARDAVKSAQFSLQDFLQNEKERITSDEFATLHNLVDKAFEAAERTRQRQTKGMKSGSGITQKDIDKTTERLAKMSELQGKINQTHEEFVSKNREGISQRELIAFREKYSQLHQEFLDIKNSR